MNMVRGAERQAQNPAWTLFGGLETLACDAAIELDNLILRRDEKLEAVRELAGTIDSSFAQRVDSAARTSLLDPREAATMHGALRDSVSAASNMANVFDLVKNASEIGQQLLSVVETEAAEPSRTQRLRELRAFCIALSRHAAQPSEPSPDEERHPYRS